VAALLRLQGRRVTTAESREALQQAEGRVAAIALVHEMLSHALDESVDFDEISDRLRTTACDLGAPGGETASPVSSSREGCFGHLSGELATTLAMVLNELLHNAVEHGFAGGPGHVRLQVERRREMLSVVVSDDGRGLPSDFGEGGGSSLGLSIVRTLVEGELHGTLEVAGNQVGGTSARFTARLTGLRHAPSGAPEK
jgi:two-component system, sensor histidine kinase PdtaS